MCQKFVGSTNAGLPLTSTFGGGLAVIGYGNVDEYKLLYIEPGYRYLYHSPVYRLRI